MINIIIQTYHEKNEDRMNELIFCILNNLENPYVNQVINLLENDNSEKSLPLLITKHPKYKTYSLNKWLKYSDAFEYCNKNLNGQICCLMNLDIMLDKESNWEDMSKELNSNPTFVFAQSRHEYILNSEKIYLDTNFDKLFHSNTQDAWIFKSPINVNDCDFEMGLLGCDNAIADRIHKSGYLVINKPMTYKIYHIDNVKGKNSTNFDKIHNETNNKRANNQKPEEKGQRMIPNYDKIINISLDSLCKQLDINHIEKYQFICDILSKKIRITN